MQDRLDAARAFIATEGAAALSLDIFDSLLMRRATGPDGVFEQAFRRLDLAPRYRGMDEAFVQQRALAEAKARRRKLAHQRIAEVRIEEIYAEFPTRLFGLPPEARSQLSEAEFAAEHDLCFADQDLLALHQQARAAGLRTGFISDTYWPQARLEALLEAKAPGLAFDFLYASCDYGRGKADGLLKLYLDRERLEPAASLHVGDNPDADIRPARRLGMAALHYAQAPAPLADIFEREDATARLLAAKGLPGSRRLDDGLRMIRRLAAHQLPDQGTLPLTGASVLAPVLAGFQRFLEHRVSALSAPGRTVAVAFLARDGFLLKRIWDATTGTPAHYIEINRRIGRIACADDAGPLQEFFADLNEVNGTAVASFFKRSTPRLEGFFAARSGGIATGRDFAAALPGLIDPLDLQQMSGTVRTRLIEHLHHAIEGLAGVTDLVLVDIGYTGTAQHTLRAVLDRADMPQRLHGVYLMAATDAFADLPADDSAVGYLDDTTIPVRSMRGLLRNVAVLEQLLSAPAGSAADYEAGQVVREADPRPAAQHAAIAAAQDQAVATVAAWPALAARVGSDPCDDIEAMRSWSAAQVARFLTFPTAAEVAAFGRFSLDVNLGSDGTIALVDTSPLHQALAAVPFTQACTLAEPPMWLAASFATVSASHGFAYHLGTLGLLSGDAFIDRVEGSVEVAIVKDGAPRLLPVTRHRTGFGEIRLHVPVARADTGSVLTIPLDGIGDAVLRPPVLRRGETVPAAFLSRRMETVLPATLEVVGARLDGCHIRAVAADGHLLVPIPASTAAVTILSLTLLPLGRAADMPAPQTIGSPAIPSPATRSPATRSLATPPTQSPTDQPAEPRLAAAG